MRKVVRRRRKKGGLTEDYNKPFLDENTKSRRPIKPNRYAVGISVSVLLIGVILAVVLPLTVKTSTSTSTIPTVTNANFRMYNVFTANLVVTIPMAFQRANFRTAQVCIDPFAFTPQSLGSLFRSDTDFIPIEYRPSSSNYTSMLIQSSPEEIYLHLFRDGTVRLSGREIRSIPQIPISLTSRKCLFYITGNNTRYATPANFQVSDCISNTQNSDNLATLFFGYNEYFGLKYFNNTLYVAAGENCLSPHMMVRFYKMDTNGTYLQPPVILNTVEHPDSENVFKLNAENTTQNNQNEASMCVLDTDDDIIVFFRDSYRSRITGLISAIRSNDNGLTWNNSATPWIDQSVPPRFNQLPPLTLNCSGLLGDPSDTLYQQCYGNVPLSSSDQQCVYDRNRKISWIAGAFRHTDGKSHIALSSSMDNGATYPFMLSTDNLSDQDDFPLIAIGKLVVYMYFRSSGFGNTYQTLVALVYNNLIDKTIAETKVSDSFDLNSFPVLDGFGDITVDASDTMLSIQSSRTAAFIGNPLYQNAIMFNKCHYTSMECTYPEIIAITDFGKVAVPAQPNRPLRISMSIAVDKNNVIHVMYIGLVQSMNLANEILFMSSDNGGKSWSAPTRINDDLHGTNTHFNAVMDYDAISHSLAFAWIDTRVDPITKRNTTHYATVLNL